MLRRTAIVTGAASGIGRGVAVELASHGVDVALLDLNEVGLTAVTAEIATMGGQATSHAVDVADWESVRNVFDTFVSKHGRLDILVTAAAVDQSVSIMEMDVADWRRIVDINLSGTFYCLKAALPHMVAASYGRIVLFGSNIALKGGQDIAHYGASKGGVHALARCAALEVARSGVVVNTVAPGPVETPMLWSLPDAWLDTKKGEIPLGRFGTVEEIVPAVLFLASESASFVTGSTLNVSGGDVLQ